MSPPTASARAANVSAQDWRVSQGFVERLVDILERRTVAFLALLWAHKWRYAALALLLVLLLLAGELVLPSAPDLWQSLTSSDFTRVGAILQKDIASLRVPDWPLLISAILLFIALPGLARWVYQREYPGTHNEALASYVARRVSQLRASDYVPKYAYEIAHRHPTTRLARAALRTAKRSSLSRARVSYIAPLPIGVCIFGRPLHDKTGLAWAAMRKALPGWSLVEWPHRFEHPETIEKLCGSRVVLWLDDLHEYANHVEAAQLDMLIDRFANNRVQVVVVATCRWHEEEREARARLGYLFDHLLPIRLTEHPDDHNADPVVSQPTLDAPIKQSSRTNGNIELKLERDIADKRAHFTRLLTGDAAAQSAATILRAMTLLRRVGIRVYPRDRVRAVANQLGLDPGDESWAEANIKLAAVSLSQARLARSGFGGAPYGVDVRVYAERARDCLYSARKIFRPPYGPPFENPDLSSYLNERIREVRERLKEVEAFGVQVTYD